MSKEVTNLRAAFASQVHRGMGRRGCFLVARTTSSILPHINDGFRLCHRHNPLNLLAFVVFPSICRPRSIISDSKLLRLKLLRSLGSKRSDNRLEMLAISQLSRRELLFGLGVCKLSSIEILGLRFVASSLQRDGLGTLMGLVSPNSRIGFDSDPDPCWYQAHAAAFTAANSSCAAVDSVGVGLSRSGNGLREKDGNGMGMKEEQCGVLEEIGWNFMGILCSTPPHHTTPLGFKVFIYLFIFSLLTL